jgi:hypothetical protein
MSRYAQLPQFLHNETIQYRQLLPQVFALFPQHRQMPMIAHLQRRRVLPSSYLQ